MQRRAPGFLGAVELPPERSGKAAPADILAARAGMAKADACCRQGSVVPVEERLNGVRVLRFRPPGATAGTVLHLHGGGFRLGCPEYVAPFASGLAQRCSVEVICPAYRLAPEHPYPAGLNDARAVLRALAAAAAAPLVVCGDSAGGGLAAGLTLLAMAEDIAVAGLVLLSAWLDLTVAAPSYSVNAATDPLFSAASARLAAELYLQGLPARDPLASPLFADLAGFPPTFISVGGGEVLADDSSAFHAALRAAAVPSDLSIVAGMDHIAVVRDASAPGAPETFAAVAKFIDQRLKKPPRRA
jgi:monoterpene epsilon-lactone hydrolase